LLIGKRVSLLEVNPQSDNQILAAPIERAAEALTEELFDMGLKELYITRQGMNSLANK
jgi:hypothetical protein